MKWFKKKEKENEIFIKFLDFEHVKSTIDDYVKLRKEYSYIFKITKCVNYSKYLTEEDIKNISKSSQCVFILGYIRYLETLNGFNDNDGIIHGNNSQISSRKNK